MILRSALDVDLETEDIDLERYPAPRHRAADTDLPGSLWAFATLVLWSAAVLVAVVGAVTFPGFNGISLIAFILFAAGAATAFRSREWS